MEMEVEWQYLNHVDKYKYNKKIYYFMCYKSHHNTKSGAVHNAVQN